MVSRFEGAPISSAKDEFRYLTEEADVSKSRAKHLVCRAYD